MSRHRTSVFVAATLSVALWASACGDGTTEPPPDPPRPTTVTVTPATAELTALDATVQLNAQVLDQNGQVMAGAAVTWASGDASVAAVDGAGLVTAAANGAATITATAGSASGTAAVTVAQKVSSVEVSPAAATVVERDTVRFEAVALDANGHAVAAAEFAWSSSDTSVAVVDGAGLVSGVGAGEVEVAAASSGVAGSAALVVEVPVPTTVTVAPDTLEFAALADTVRLMAEVRDQIGRVMEGEVLAWASGDTMVAVVDSAGLVGAVGNGAATVTAMAGEASGEAVVTVMQSAGSVVVSPAADTVALGDTLRLEAVAFDANGHVVAGAAFTWSSSDAPVARVDASGLVTGAGEGTATITATAGDARGTAEITVQNPDRAALEALYHATDGPNWVNNQNWLTDAPLRDWYGVQVSAAGRVQALRLMDNNLVGPIPPELGNLSNLATLRLSRNGLEGAILPELGNLTSLIWLDLGTNNLSYPIPPELGNLVNLTRLSLYGNSTIGPIPPELGNLVNLTSLSLSSTGLEGPIPPELGNLAKLEWLNLQNNNLTRSIPSELGSLGSLQTMHLGGNRRLTGAIPQSFLQLDQIEGFTIDLTEICTPGTSVFVAWLQGIEDYRLGPAGFCNAADVAVLEALYDVTGGSDWSLASGWLGDGPVEEWYGVGTDSLGRVTALDLTRNGLAGALPANLGDLARMTSLRIGGNALTGRLPMSLAKASLLDLHYADTELCAPAGEAFRAWLNAISSHEGTGVECAPLSDRETLELLYGATGGPGWTNNANWLTEAPLAQWYGVSVVGEDRVTGISLPSNNLTGSLPAELGNLANLTTLSLESNNLAGTILPLLGNLANLTTLSLESNSLIGAIPAELGNLPELRQLSLRNNELTGAIPAELGNLPELRHLSLQNNELTGPIPPELGDLANLTTLSLESNSLTGAIPAVLGDLPELRQLRLRNNELTGPIPPDLGYLANLTTLSLSLNNLTGPIPPELGGLANLTTLSLESNSLTGAIPAELGNLANLTVLSLSSNNLTGPIPPELGNLANLTWLYLHDNGLTGTIPPMLGNLSAVRHLSLATNDLSGPVPAGTAGMSSLQHLDLTNNSPMSGPLPTGLTALRQLDALLAGGTGLCAPTDPDFRMWLTTIHKSRIATCAEGDPPPAYIVQAVQSAEFPVPLIAGRRTMLRVFPTAGRTTTAAIPAVRARFYRNGSETHEVDIPGKSGPIPTEVYEGNLSTSVNAEIPEEVIQPGLEMVIEVDPGGTLDPTLGVARRIPETGRLALDVRALPRFDLTFIPFIWTEEPDSSVVHLVEATVRDPENHELLQNTRMMLPVGNLSVSGHEPVLSSTNNGFTILAETRVIRVMEGGTGHYMSTIARPSACVGTAELGGRVSFSHPVAITIAHELGHNMNLVHAPWCTRGEPSYPHAYGSIGAWGYDFRHGGKLVSPIHKDLMAYCGPFWVSDYHFTNALRYRLFDEGSPGASAASASAPSLLLWGGINGAEEPYLEPAFVVDAPPALPDSAGEHRGHRAHGRR